MKRKFIFLSVPKVRNRNMFYVWKGSVSEYICMCPLLMKIKDLKCTWKCACVDGCLTVGNWGRSCECPSCQSVCDCYDMHVTCPGDQYVKCPNIRKYCRGVHY